MPVREDVLPRQEQLGDDAMWVGNEAYRCSGYGDWVHIVGRLLSLSLGELGTRNQSLGERNAQAADRAPWRTSVPSIISAS